MLLPLFLVHVVNARQAAQEQLQLMQLTIESQSKTKLIKASSTLFDLLLHLFELKSSVGDSSIEFDDAEVELLEDTLVEGVISMTLKLNDATFRPFFVRLVDRAGSSMTFYKFLAAFFDKFKVGISLVPLAVMLTSAVDRHQLFQLHRRAGFPPPQVSREAKGHPSPPHRSPTGPAEVIPARPRRYHTPLFLSPNHNPG